MTSRHVARAILLNRYGPPEVMEYSSIAVPALAPHEVRIKTTASAINHTDLKIRAGVWPVRKAHPFPYVPGVEVVGVIEELGEAVNEWKVGQSVITMMQGLGGVRAERHGAYSETVVVDADALALIPSHIDSLRMAALGLVGVTAYWGLARIGPLRDRRILVTGAAGGVGSAAVAIARAQGASVVGVMTRPEQADYIRALGADEVVVSAKGIAPGLEPASVDGILDSVGGHFFNHYVSALRAHGVLSLVGAVAGGDVQFDAWQLIHPVTLTGYSTEDLDGSALRTAISALTTLMIGNSMRSPDYQVMHLADAARAHQLMEEKKTGGRVLLVPR